MNTSNDPRLTWSAQVAQYPSEATTGVGYFRGELSSAQHPGAYVDCLLYRIDGLIVGILNHFPQDLLPWERAGNITVRVHEDYRRQGIGSALMREAWSRWPFNAQQQRYSEEGHAFIRALLRSQAPKSA